MRKMRQINWGQKILTLVSVLAFAMVLGLFADPFAFISNAESQGKITASSAKIRQEASTSSPSLGSAAQNSTVSIRSQVTGSDGKVWYEVFIDANTLGFIRSDLVQITDGTTPPTGTGSTNNSTPSVNTNENIPEVTAVQPVSAKVTGSDSVRVRSLASTSSQILCMAKRDLALTVVGQTNDTSGKVWYQVTFMSENAQVTGFIRSDYVALDGEVLPVTDVPTEPPVEDAPAEPETPAEPVVQTKDWDTQRIEGKWYLTDNVAGENYDIEYIFESVKTNSDLYAASQKKVKSQQAWIIILVILALAMGGAIAFLVFKIKDMVDSAYFAEVERETIRRRTGEGASGRVMHTVGAERRPGGPGQGGPRPNGARPTGAPNQGQGGQRSNGARPAGAPNQGQGGQRPNGARPTGAPNQGQGGQRPNGARPTGASNQGQGGQRPMGERTAGAPNQGQGGPRPNGQRPSGEPVQGNARPRPQQENENQGRKSRNFMTDEDEFEFEFLNWDGEEEE